MTTNYSYFLQDNTNYDDLIHHLMIYQNKMEARNVTLQAQLSQVTQQLFRPLQCEVELFVAKKSLKESCEAL